MMGTCDECPGREAFQQMINEFAESDALPDNITLKQWTTVDRAELITVIMPKEFLHNLIEKLDSLKTHHFISKMQTQFLREKKEKINENECIVLADFTEILPLSSKMISRATTGQTGKQLFIYLSITTDKMENFLTCVYV